jgi:hypothetical protein
VILVVDHYDSFTFNLVQLIESLGERTEVVKSDAESADRLAERRPAAVILSPGPGRPEEAGCFPELLEILPDETFEGLRLARRGRVVLAFLFQYLRHGPTPRDQGDRGNRLFAR